MIIMLSNNTEVVKPQCPYKDECCEHGFNDDCLEPFGKAVMNPCPHYKEIMFQAFGEVVE